MKKLKQPDRWEKMAEKEYERWLRDCPQTRGWLHISTTLLRREHQAIVRMVQGERMLPGSGRYEKVYNSAIDDVLAKLKARGQ